MSQSWPNCQPIIGFYRAGTGTTNLYQFFIFSNHSRRKIELINLTNNSGSKRKPPSAAYHTRPSPIIRTESENIGLARKFSSDYQVVCQPHG